MHIIHCEWMIYFISFHTFLLRNISYPLNVNLGFGIMCFLALDRDKYETTGGRGGDGGLVCGPAAGRSSTTRASLLCALHEEVEDVVF